MKRLVVAVVVVVAFTACRFDPAYRDDSIAAPCVEGEVECRGSVLVRCEAGVVAALEDCGARSEVCASTLGACASCIPGERICEGAAVRTCSADGRALTTVVTCDEDRGTVCRSGACVDLCGRAASLRSSVGCEYWPVDLDNAVDAEGNAAAQQYAVIVTNPQPDAAATVTIEEDEALPGQPAFLRVVATARIGSGRLETFRLGPREVDGSPPDTPNGGTGTALTRHAYRLRSTVPVAAFQFNPLQRVNAFSNDASMLLPTASLNRSGASYVVAGWPQTLARTSTPDTNFGQDLRAFLAIVGTAPDTLVHLRTTARVIPGGAFDAGIPQNGEVDVRLQPFEVLNLETGDFDADFTGSTIAASAPVVVYSGSEASDAPSFATLATRSCCGDHLETQVTPMRAVGRHYVIARMPNRSRAIAAAGGAVAAFDEPEIYRVVSTGTSVTTVKTTLAAPNDVFQLATRGGAVTLPVHEDFELTADGPVLVADVQVGQAAAGIPQGLPGGDPSLLLVPPVEQWLTDYTLVTPSTYAFDFLVLTAPVGAAIYVDGLGVDGAVCEASATGAYKTYRCQLSYPIVGTSGVLDGHQNDGVHRVQADRPIGVLVYGFDRGVSYAYPGGTRLSDISADQASTP